MTEERSFIMYPSKIYKDMGWGLLTTGAIFGLNFLFSERGLLGIGMNVLFPEARHAVFFVYLGLAVASILGGVYLLLFPSMEKIVVEGEHVTYHYHFKRKYGFLFSEIKKTSYNTLSEEYKCYNKDGEVILQFSQYWTGYPLMVRRLKAIDKMPRKRNEAR